MRINGKTWQIEIDDLAVVMLSSMWLSLFIWHGNIIDTIGKGKHFSRNRKRRYIFYVQCTALLADQCKSMFIFNHCECAILSGWSAYAWNGFEEMPYNRKHRDQNIGWTVFGVRFFFVHLFGSICCKRRTPRSISLSLKKLGTKPPFKILTSTERTHTHIQLNKQIIYCFWWSISDCLSCHPHSNAKHHRVPRKRRHREQIEGMAEKRLIHLFILLDLAWVALDRFTIRMPCFRLFKVSFTYVCVCMLLFFRPNAA